MKSNQELEFNGASEKKYELIKDEASKRLESYGYNLYRLRALRDFGSVKKGDLGGFIAGEHNLSHAGNCWVHDPAMVYGTCHVSENGQVGGAIGLPHGSVSGDRTIGKNWNRKALGQPHGAVANPAFPKRVEGNEKPR